MSREEAKARGPQLTRRDFLLKGSLGIAALLAVSTPLRNRLGGSKGSNTASLPKFPGQGSIFQPRLDQRVRGWLRWHNPFSG